MISTHMRVKLGPLVLSCVLFAVRAQAAPGDLDLSFGGFGAQAIASSPEVTTAMALTPDGKIVTAGTSGIRLVVRRYLPDGRPDYLFDSDGVAYFTNLSYAMNATAVAVQPDGRIVIAGWAELGLDDFLVARVLPSGSIDASFGAAGYSTTDFAGQGDRAEAVAVQPNGMIVVAGTSRVGGDDDFSVARYTANGALDAGFDGDGKLTIGFGGDDSCHGLALQEDGKIVLAGDGSADFPNYDQDICMARLMDDGAFDDALDADGKLTAGMGGHDVGRAVAIQPDGRIIVVGYSDPTAPSGKLIRFFGNGVPDFSLDGDGIMSLPESDRALDVLVQTDGRILILSEFSPSAGDKRFAIHRLLPTGEADASFYGIGHANYDVGAYDVARRMALLPDGRILMHGTSGATANTQNSTMLVRLWQDGAPDVGGKQTLGFPGTFMGPGANERGQGAAVRPDGKIVVVGELANAAGTENDFGLARFTPDGEIDPGFGTNGHAAFSFHNADVARAVALQPDGKIVVAGHAGSGDGINFLVARFNSNGTLDPTFGFFGFNVLDFLGGPDYAQAVAIAPDGKLVVAGTVYNGASYVFGVCRFTADGIVDTGFDLDGKQLHELSPGAIHEAKAVIVQPDLKIVVGGHVDYAFAMARYNENGSVDYDWGPSGQGHTIFQMGGPGTISALALTSGGLFYAAGSRTAAGNTDFAVAQVNSSGYVAACECSFPCCTWLTGRAYADWGGYDAAYAIDVRSDDRVVVAGTASGQFGWAQFSTTSSNASALGRVDLPGVGESAQAVRFVGANHLVVAGTQDFNGNQNFALARFETTVNPLVDVGDPIVDATQGAFRLHPTCPNPTARSTMVTFDLAQRTSVRVGLYDAAGRRVRLLAEGPMTAGRHQLTWDGTDDGGRRVAAGMYFVRAEAGQTRSSQKLLLLD